MLPAPGSSAPSEGSAAEVLRIGIGQAARARDIVRIIQRRSSSRFLGRGRGGASSGDPADRPVPHARDPEPGSLSEALEPSLIEECVWTSSRGLPGSGAWPSSDFSAVPPKSSIAFSAALLILSPMPIAVSFVDTMSIDTVRPGLPARTSA